MSNIWWKYLDYTSIEPKILIRGENRYKTKVGALISLLSSIIILILGGYFFYVFLENKEITIISSTDQKHFIPTYDLVKNPYMFRLFRPNPKGESMLDERIAKVLPTLMIYKNNQINKVIYLEIENCSFEKHFKEDWHKQQIGFNISQFNCFKNNYINLTDDTLTRERNFLNLYISECYNTTENNNHCYPSEYISNYLLFNLTFLEYYFPTMEVDNNNFTHPLTNKFFTESIPISRRFQYRYLRNLKTINYYSDEGAVFEEKRKYDGFGIDLQKDELLGLDNLKNSNIAKNFFGVLSHNVKPDYIEIYNRRITKLQTVLANVGGLIKFIMVFAQIISQFITSQMMYVDISNTFISFNDNKNKINLNNSQNEVVLNNFTKRNITKTNQVSLMQAICPKTLFKKDSSAHIVDKCRNIIKHESCIEKLIKYHYEFDKLKSVIFNEKEKFIFENLKNININDAIEKIKKKEKIDISQDVSILAEINKKHDGIYSKRLIEL